MSKKINRKQKWRNITLNKANIDEYLQDLYNDTSGNYITQGVSFNKDDNYQMTLLKNALIAHGSFSGFIKNLLHNHFEKHGKLDDTIWKPNEIVEADELGDNTPSSPLLSPVEQNKDEPEPIESTSASETTVNIEEKPPQPQPTNLKSNKNENIVKKRISNFSR